MTEAVSNRSLNESMALLKKFDELKQEVLVNYVVDEH